MVGNAIRVSVRAWVTRARPASTGSVEPHPHRALASKEGQVLSQHDVCAVVSCSPATYRACGCTPRSCNGVYSQASCLLVLGISGDDTPPCRVHILIAYVRRVQEGGSP